MEGRHCYNPASGCTTTGKTMPIAEYSHDSGRCAVTGGYVYRGRAIPALVGGYLFADYCSGEIRSIPANAPTVVPSTVLLRHQFHDHLVRRGCGGELLCDRPQRRAHVPGRPRLTFVTGRRPRPVMP